MIRVLITGNSHVAALKSAREVGAWPGMDLSFFAAPQRSFQQMVVRQDKIWGLPEGFRAKRGLPHNLIVRDLNGAEQVDLTQFDWVVLTGFAPGARQVAELLAGCNIDGLRDAGCETLLSAPGFTSLAKDLAKRLRPATGFHGWDAPRLALIPQPATAESCLQSSYADHAVWARLAAAPHGVRAAFHQFDVRRAADLAEIGISYLPQPAETRTDFGCTAASWLAPGAGDVKPGEAHQRGDHSHMNAAYGALCLRDIAAAAGLGAATDRLAG